MPVLLNSSTTREVMDIINSINEGEARVLITFKSNTALAHKYSRHMFPLSTVKLKVLHRYSETLYKDFIYIDKMSDMLYHKFRT